ncbi:MAG: hypothetical protein IT305_07400 [Chloroflexi bacterium]|nr:hypothetical protein [Chloroflexota bacterium]
MDRRAAGNGHGRRGMRALGALRRTIGRLGVPRSRGASILYVVAVWALVLVSLMPPLAAAQSNDGPDLLVPTSRPGAARAPSTRATARSRTVEVHFGAFWGSSRRNVDGSTPKSPIGKDERLRLALFDDTVVTAVGDRVEARVGANGFIWYGHVPGPWPNPVMLVVDPTADMLTGSVQVDGTSYQISPLGNGVHLVTQKDTAQLPGDPEPLHDEPTPPIGRSRAQSNPRADDGSVIDVLVVYTPALATERGGAAAMAQLVDGLIAESNTSYAQSGVTTRLRLAGQQQISYTETSYSDVDLDRLQGTSDGFMDSVHQLRDQVKADLVMLMVRGPLGYTPDPTGICGLAYNIAASASQAFAVMDGSNCSLGIYTFHHELGHLMGARHDWAADPTDNVPYTFNHGYIMPSYAWRTVMATTSCGGWPGGCPRINYFSNPSSSYQGAALGVPSGSFHPTDNRQTINLRAATVASFRESGAGGGAPANDNLGAATVMSSLPFSVTVATTSATTEAGEPTTPSCNNLPTPIGRTVWFRYAPATTQRVTLTTRGSDFDTLLYAWRGASYGQFNSGFCNDDFGGSRQAELSFDAQAGETYSIQIGGYNGASGTLQFQVLGEGMLTVTKSGNGTVTSADGGINCGSTCARAYDSGTTVTLAAAPATGFAFDGWGGACTESGPSCQVRISGNTQVTATFVSCQPRNNVHVQAAPNGDGRLRATITAGAGTIKAIQIGGSRPIDNARVDIVNGPSGITSTTTHAPSAGTSQITLLISRQAAGAVTVPLTVTDACGAWPTFVGGGAAAF